MFTFRPTTCRWIVFTFFLHCLPWSLLCAADAEVDFREQIQPILTKHCTKCHGGVKQAGDLSFIYQQQVLDSGVIEPGDPDNSELIARVTSDDPDLRMPPVEEHPEPLTATEIELLRRWIQTGAQWDAHWAFVKPERPPLPEVSQASWPSQELDHFVLARLDAEGLEPSPPASPAEWLRRVSFDLIGLPPTVEELERFVQACAAQLDDRPAVYRAEVDRLLASPHYGERWAAMWLDLARYADSQGYEKDLHRNAWPYRDWVIDAFNRDLPFDEFTIKQLAGDLLSNPTVDDLIATAFHRNTQTNTEGGTDDEEFRTAAVIDRINTTWTVWHATTFGCTQCHSHPYDPFGHDEYYKFMAFFNNTVDADIDNDQPTLKLPVDKQERDWAMVYQADVERRQLREELNRTGRELALAVDDWQPAVPIRVHASHGQLEINAQNQVVAAGGTFPIGVRYEVDLKAQALQAMWLEILPESDNPADWPERGAVLSHVELALLLPDGSQQPLKINELVADHLAGFYDPKDSLSNGASGFGGYPKLIGPRWAVLVLQQPVNPPDGAKLQVKIANQSSTTGAQSTHLRRFSFATSNAPAWQEIANSPERKEKWQQVEKLQAEQNAWQGITVPIMRSRGEVAARPTRMFVRGNWLVRDELVTPAVPEELHPLANEKAGRLDVARWLVSPEDPLTARVLANRLWAELYGIGIVETLEDFGSTGTKPSHPALLDLLAVRLQQDHRWHLKSFLRELVLSSTYCQTARTTDQLRTRDPRNRLLARGPRTRLSAEMVRDQALTVSGLLTHKIGGPSVMPPQPDSVWQAVYNNSQWETETGPNRYRRGLYTYWKRTSPYPSFMSFDAPSREVCSARRIATNTPLQALVTLNDPVYVECSQSLAQQAITHGGESPRKWISWAYRAVTQHAPTESALSELVSLYDIALADFKSTPEQEPDKAITVEAQALSIVTNTLLNLDEAMTK